MKNKKIVIIASAAESLLNFRLQLMKDFLAQGYQVTAIAPSDEVTAQPVIASEARQSSIEHALRTKQKISTGLPRFARNDELLTMTIKQSGRDDESVSVKLARLGVKYLPVVMQRNGNNPIKDFKTLLHLFWLIKKEKPSMVFSYTIKPVIYGTMAARLAGVPTIFSMLTGLGYAFSNSNLKSRLIGAVAKTLFRFSLKFNRTLFFQNKDNLQTLLDLKLINKQQSVVIVNGSGVDVQFFSPALLPERMTFLMIARLLYDKGIREYLAAAKIIKSRFPQVIFKLVGYLDTNPNSMTQDELTQWIESGVIDYLGKLTDVRSAIKESSVYVLPSYSEGTPRTVLEAMAMGRPIITTDAPGCRETVVNGENGFLIPVQDVEALCKAMEYFICHPVKVEVMGCASREMAVEKYDVRKVNHSMLNAMGVEFISEKNNETIGVE